MWNIHNYKFGYVCLQYSTCLPCKAEKQWTHIFWLLHPKQALWNKCMCKGVIRTLGFGIFTQLLLFSLPRCFFICSIALWLEKIDADTLTLAWRNSVAFFSCWALCCFLPFWCGLYLSMWTKTHFLSVYDMLYSGFLLVAGTWKNSYVCNLICLFVVDDLQSCIICLMLI